MRAFAQLYQVLDSTTSSRQKIQAIAHYLGQTQASDAAWAVYFLGGGKLRRLLPVRELRQIALEQSGLPEWLFDECYESVGDLAETIALLWPQDGGEKDVGLEQWVQASLLSVQATQAARKKSAAVSRKSAIKDASKNDLGDTPSAQHAAGGIDTDVQTSLQAEQALQVQMRQQLLHEALTGWDASTRFLCLKLITGGLRVGVSRQTVVRALALHCGLEPAQMAQRMVGYLSHSTSATSQGQGSSWPDAARYERLVSTDSDQVLALEPGQPYPFFLAHPLPAEISSLAEHLGSHEQWQFEWKWDGIRVQVIHRAGQVWLWSRGEELINAQFPEVCQAARALPENTVIDGELLVWQEGSSAPETFAALQRRLGRSQVSTRLMQQLPVVLLGYDLLEFDGTDWRTKPLAARRQELERIMATMQGHRWFVSPRLMPESWPQVEQLHRDARERGVEGLMIKALAGEYGIGRTRADGLWYKYKCDPMTIDAVLIYAQRGHGRRAGLYTDYTFGVWNAPPGDPQRKLVPVAKAYSGLSDAQIREVDALIRKSTQESFGPVRKVDPTLVFELGFEGIAISARHKSGVALRFPRMLRWRTDKPASEADTLYTLKGLLP